MSGWHRFSKAYWQAKAIVGTAPFKAEEDRIAALWGVLDAEQKAIWDGDAAAVNQATADIANGPEYQRSKGVADRWGGASN